MLLKGQRFWFYSRGTGIISWFQKWLERPSIELASQTLPFWASSGAKPPAKTGSPAVAPAGTVATILVKGKPWVPQEQVPYWGPEPLRTQPSALEYLWCVAGQFLTLSCHMLPGMSFLFP